MNEVRRKALKNGAISIAALTPLLLWLGQYDQSGVVAPHWVQPVAIGFGMPAVLALFKAIGEVVVGRRWLGKLRGGFEARQVGQDRGAGSA